MHIGPGLAPAAWRQVCHGTRYVQHGRGWYVYGGVRTVRGAPEASCPVPPVRTARKGSGTYVSAQLRAIDEEDWHRSGEEAQAGAEARGGSRGLRGRGRRSGHGLLRGGAARRLLAHAGGAADADGARGMLQSSENASGVGRDPLKSPHLTRSTVFSHSAARGSSALTRPGKRRSQGR
eukprot:scaffold55017_cov57-Phaeocystis_antarctica.AAC.3